MNRSMSPRNLYLLIAIGCGSLYNSLITTDLSLLRYGQKLRGHNKISAGGFTTDFEKLSGICQVLAVPANTTATLINLIQYGDAWATETKKKTTGEFDRFRKGERVPGCMADVRITTTFNYDHLESITKHPRISVDGSADSRVAQGILALLCEVGDFFVSSLIAFAVTPHINTDFCKSQGLENQECSNVLTLSPTDLSRECGLNSLLPVGRLNGLHNMVTVIHNQIKSELLRLREKENALLTADMDRERNADSLRALNPLNSDWSSVEGVDTSDEVAVLLSGGVDSSVALKLLQLQGHKVRAFYLKIWLEDEVAHLNE